MEWKQLNKSTGLTLTWDVFKWNGFSEEVAINIWLTLTWDVFKFRKDTAKGRYNCRLTLTWDVFKWSNKCWKSFL